MRPLSPSKKRMKRSLIVYSSDFVRSHMGEIMWTVAMLSIVTLLVLGLWK